MKTRKRKLVHWAKYNDLAFVFSNHDNRQAEHKISTHVSEMLASEMLLDLPKQVESYFLLSGLDASNIQRRLSPEDPPLFVEPADRKVVRGPLEPHANYKSVVKSAYAIASATGKERIPLDILLSGFSNPVLEGHAHYDTIQNPDEKPAYSYSIEAQYDHKLKCVWDPNYLENLYEAQCHNRKTKDKTDKGANMASGHKRVMNYVENPFENILKPKQPQGPRINMKIDTQVITIDPNQPPEAQVSTSKTSKSSTVSKKSSSNKNSPKLHRKTDNVTIDNTGLHTKQKVGNKQVEVSIEPLKPDSVNFIHEDGPKPHTLASKVSPRSPPQIQRKSDSGISCCESSPDSKSESSSSFEAGPEDSSKTGTGLPDFDEIRKGNSSANPFSQITSAMDKGESLHNPGRRDSIVSLDSMDGSVCKILYVPIPRPNTSRNGQQNEFDYSKLNFSDFF